MELELPEDAIYAGRTAAGPWTYRAQSEALAAESDGKTARFVLYSGSEVRSWYPGAPGDVIAVREFRLANYRRNPVILADHNPDNVIGWGSAQIVDNEGKPRLEGDAHWDLHESNPLAVLIAGQHQRGIRGAVSIGFMPGKGTVNRTALTAEDPWYVDPEKWPSWMAGRYIRQAELYEWSSVSVPRDPGALQLQSWAREAEDPDERLRRIVTEIVSREHSQWVLDAVRNDAHVRTAITACALAELPNPATPAKPTDWWKDYR